MRIVLAAAAVAAALVFVPTQAKLEPSGSADSDANPASEAKKAPSGVRQESARASDAPAEPQPSALNHSD